MPITRRQELFFEAFNARRITTAQGGQSPFAVFVKKLQESLTRMENLDVVTVSQSSDGLYSLNMNIVEPKAYYILVRFQTEFPFFARTSTPITSSRS